MDKNTLIKQGDKLEVFVEDYGVNSEGIAKKDGFVIFIPFALKGERVLIRIDHVKKNFAYAALLSVLEASPFRVTPVCNRFTRCGGCDILNVAYEEQLRIKKSAVETTIARNYREGLLIDDVVPSKQFAYRNKMALPFGTVNGKTAVGFYQEKTHKIASITKCFLQGVWAENLIDVVLSYANGEGIAAYDEKSAVKAFYATFTRA